MSEEAELSSFGERLGGSSKTTWRVSFRTGGDPNDFSTLRMSKGRLYDFNGLFRRDRQYFDYDLLGNPLVPLTTYKNTTGTYVEL